MWIIAVVLLSGHFALIFQHNATPYLDAGSYTHYTAKRPYQYRVLMAPVMATLMETFGQPRPRAALAKLPAFAATPEAAAYLTINAIAFGLSCFLIAAMARRLFGGGPRVQLVVAIYIALVYLYLCLNPNLAFILPYDMPALVLSQACLLSILTRRWIWLYPLFALGVLNRETVFLVIVYLAVRGYLEPSQRRSAWMHVVGLSGVWVFIKFGLYLQFAHLASDEGMRLGYNLQTLAKPWQWPALLPAMASFALAVWSLRVTRSGREWAVTGCVGFLLVFAVGQITETRAFADVMTFFAVAIAQALWVTNHQDPASSA